MMEVERIDEQYLLRIIARVCGLRRIDLEILRVLYRCGDCCTVRELETFLGKPRIVIRQRLKVLMEKGLVKYRRVISSAARFKSVKCYYPTLSRAEFLNLLRSRISDMYKKLDNFLCSFLECEDG